MSLQAALIGHVSLMLDLLGWQLTAALPTYSAPLAIAVTPPEVTSEKGRRHHGARCLGPTEN